MEGQLSAWAEGDANVRAVFLGGSRADPSADVDELSDWDVEAVVDDLEPFLRGDEWLQRFGGPLIRWPLSPGPTLDGGGVTRLVLFEDGTRIDFQLRDTAARPAALAESRFRVLRDPDGLFEAAAARRPGGYSVRPPSAAEYRRVCLEMWWDATYVPKCLFRGRLPMARYMLDCVMRQQHLNPMVEWKIGIHTDWTANPGPHGRDFVRYLDRRTWSDYAATFARGECKPTWRAFEAMAGLFGRLGREVGGELGYGYPDRTERRILDYCRQVIQHGGYGGRPGGGPDEGG